MKGGSPALVVAVVIVAGLVGLAWVVAPLTGREASPSVAAVPSGLDARTSSPIGTPRATPSPAPTSTAEPTPSPTASPSPSPTPTETPAPEETLDPRLAYAAFLAHLDDARTIASDLSQGLLASAQAGDEAATRATARQMLSFADDQRVWLAGNPPADCYRKAHTAASEFVEAYARVADLAIEWADADAGLDKLAALARLGVAGDAAGAALDALVKALGKSTCLD